MCVYDVRNAVAVASCGSYRTHEMCAVYMFKIRSWLVAMRLHSSPSSGNWLGWLVDKRSVGDRCGDIPVSIRYRRKIRKNLLARLVVGGKGVMMSQGRTCRILVMILWSYCSRCF